MPGIQHEMQKEMAVQADGDVDTYEAKGREANGNEGAGSSRYQKRMATISIRSDWRFPVSGQHFVDPETVMAAQVIVQSIAGFMLFAAGVAVGKLL